MANNLNFERKLQRKGWRFIIGIDEAGRGPLAGPVIACAVVFVGRFKPLTSNFKYLLKQIKDSKKLSPKKREEIYKFLVSHPEIEWARGLVSAKIIDRINILEATKLAMRRAVKNLERRTGHRFPKKKTILIIDGNQKIGSEFVEMPIIKADERVFLCICGSILAKVERDKLMKKYHRVYPQYNLRKHKGYPTKEHRRIIKKYGLSSLHRKTFSCG